MQSLHVYAKLKQESIVKDDQQVLQISQPQVAATNLTKEEQERLKIRERIRLEMMGELPPVEQVPSLPEEIQRPHSEEQQVVLDKVEEQHVPEQMQPVEELFEQSSFFANANNISMATTSKRPKFKNKMAVVEPMQDLLIKSHAGTSLKLSWKIKNSSKGHSWPILPEIKNFSKDPIITETENAHLFYPVKIDQILHPDEEYIFETDITIPMDQRKFYTLNLFLTNPQRNHEKFGDGLIAIIEILPIAEIMLSDEKPLETSIYYNDEEEKQEQQDPEQEEEDENQQKFEEIEQSCVKAVNMIDDLLAFDEDAGDLDDIDARLAALSRQSSQQKDTLNYDSARMTMGDEEIRRVRERAELEKESSLRQFQELVQVSMSEVKQQINSNGWEDVMAEEERAKIEKARKIMQNSPTKREMRPQ
ncbi:hypothetical protein FGO68_gene1846 [Halteria grandinella]|uniref:Uncharacterized protein n=1 Tax=Halteria grandinella TaxID=5974 RepID=A0A8J8NDW2_HALGN|nr:hypothetical protein FGO68_gene1846 [Halteria grandinella]